MSLRKVTRYHRIFPSDEAVFKVIYLASQNIAKKWTMPIRDWKPALKRFAVEFGPLLWESALIGQKRPEIKLYWVL